MSYKYLPQKCIPASPYKTDEFVYRVIPDSIPTPDGFMPTFVDKAKRNKTANLEMLFEISSKEKECGEFSLSVYLDMDIMIRKIYGTALSKIRPFIAKGTISEEKGVAEKPNTDKHIDYYLSDYEENNPYDDFCVIGKIEDFVK